MGPNSVDYDLKLYKLNHKFEVTLETQWAEFFFPFLAENQQLQWGLGYELDLICCYIIL